MGVVQMVMKFGARLLVGRVSNMRIFLYSLLSFFLFTQTSNAWMLSGVTAGVTVSGGSSYDHHDPFESGVCDDGWSTSGSVCDYAHATTPMSGTYEMECISGEDSTITFDSTYPDVYVAFEWSSIPGDTYENVIFKDSGDAVLAYLQFRTDRLRIYQTGGDFVTIAAPDDIDIVGGENFFKIRLTAGTGLDADIEVWADTGGSEWGSSESTNNGTWTNDVAKITFEGGASNTIYIDEVRVLDSDLTTVDEDSASCP